MSELPGGPIGGCEGAGALCPLWRGDCVPSGEGIVSPWEWGRFMFLEIATIDVRLFRTNFGEGAAGAALNAAQ